MKGLNDNHFHIHLGMVPNGKRSVTPVPAKLLGLVPPPDDSVVTVKESDADPIKDTVPLIKQKVKRTLWQTKKLAAALQGDNTADTVRNDWDFIFKHIQYVQDPDGVECVRSPRKLIYDGIGDCDCFTVCLSSLLMNQGIDHSLRVAKYNKGDDWSHIYVIVPTDDGYITVDPVVHRFNYEEPFTDKKDFTMKLQSLDGFSRIGLGDCGVSTTAPATTATADNSDTTQPAKEVTQILLQSTKALQNRGLMRGDDFLDLNNIPYQAVEQDGQTVYNATTPSGIQQVAAFVPSDPNSQKAMLAKLNAPATQNATQQPTASTAQVPALSLNNNLVKLGIAFGVGYILNSILSSKSGVNGLGAPGKKKLAVVHI